MNDSNTHLWISLQHGSVDHSIGSPFWLRPIDLSPQRINLIDVSDSLCKKHLDFLFFLRGIILKMSRDGFEELFSNKVTHENIPKTFWMIKRFVEPLLEFVAHTFTS